MKRKKINKDTVLIIFAIILILGGMAVFFYPTVSNYLAEKNQAEIIEVYNEVVSELDEEQIEEEFAKAQEYNESLSGEPVHDPFIEGSGYGIPDNYYDLLNITDDGVMAYIDIPKISVYLPIYHGTTEEVLQKGVGHIETTSLPIGGTSTQCVLSAHTGLPSAELFTRIDELEIGDVFYIHVLNKTLAYKVYETKVILPEEISELQIVSGKDLVTLVTCTPYGVNTHRLLVKAERTEYEEGEEVQQEEASLTYEDIHNALSNKKYYIIAITIGIIIISMVIIFIIIRTRKKKHKI